MKNFIFIIEDDADIMDSLSSALELEDYQVKGAKNGAEGLKYLQDNAQKPDLIILDVMMPVMNGLEFRKHQLQDNRLKDIPTIVLTADRSFHMNNQDKGLVGSFKKPIDLDLLLDTLKKAFS